MQRAELIDPKDGSSQACGIQMPRLSMILYRQASLPSGMIYEGRRKSTSGGPNMTLEESLKLERYKLVTERQKYFTDLAKGTFNYYARTFASFAVGAIALVSLKRKLSIEAEVIAGIIQMIAILLTLIAIGSIVQVAFCLKRWYGFRDAECEINPLCPRPESWAILFEGMYGLGIGASIIVIWWGVRYITFILGKL
jgi:hypothetical protein